MSDIATNRVFRGFLVQTNPKDPRPEMDRTFRIDTVDVSRGALVCGENQGGIEHKPANDCYYYIGTSPLGTQRIRSWSFTGNEWKALLEGKCIRREDNKDEVHEITLIHNFGTAEALVKKEAPLDHWRLQYWNGNNGWITAASFARGCDTRFGKPMDDQIILLEARSYADHWPTRIVRVIRDDDTEVFNNGPKRKDTWI